MPFSNAWYIEGEVIYSRYRGIVTREELEESLIERWNMINSGQHPLVHCIIDVGDITQNLPLNKVLPLVRKYANDRMGWSITLREKSALLRLVIGISHSVLKARTRSLNTMDEAVAVLTQFDPAIHWDKARPEIISSGSP